MKSAFQSSNLVSMKLSENLKFLLKSKGVSVSRLAELVNVPAQTIFNWESGAMPKNLEQIKRVATFFGLTLDSICFDDLTSPRDVTGLFQAYSEEINAGTYEVILRPIKKS